MAQILKQLNKEATYFMSSSERRDLKLESKMLRKQRTQRAFAKKERKSKMAERRVQMIATGRMRDKKAKIRRNRD